MVFSVGFREVFFDVFKPVLLFRPVMEGLKPMLPTDPFVESGGATYETEQGNNKKRKLWNDRK